MAWSPPRAGTAIFNASRTSSVRMCSAIEYPKDEKAEAQRLLPGPPTKPAADLFSPHSP